MGAYKKLLSLDRMKTLISNLVNQRPEARWEGSQLQLLIAHQWPHQWAHLTQSLMAHHWAHWWVHQPTQLPNYYHTLVCNWWNAGSLVDLFKKKSWSLMIPNLSGTDSSWFKQSPSGRIGSSSISLLYSLTIGTPRWEWHTKMRVPFALSWRCSRLWQSVLTRLECVGPGQAKPRWVQQVQAFTWLWGQEVCLWVTTTYTRWRIRICWGWWTDEEDNVNFDGKNNNEVKKWWYLRQHRSR